ncbi:60S ribosomal protein L27, mitochondrial, partial [Dispira parvispora]
MLRYIRGIFRGASREPMTGKRGRNFYKGTRTGAMGRHNKYGGYRLDYSRVRTYVVPDLTNCSLKPYVSRQTEKISTTIADQPFTSSTGS